MDVIERRRANCPELGQIVRRYCVRIAVSWLCTSRIVVARASHYWPFFHHAIGDWTIFYLGVILPKHILCAKVFRGILQRHAALSCCRSGRKNKGLPLIGPWPCIWPLSEGSTKWEGIRAPFKKSSGIF